MVECKIRVPYWNRKDLAAPTMISRTLISAQPEKTSRRLSKVLKEIVTTLGETSGMDVDAALLSRLIYRMKRVFRNDKILQGMQKVYRCLSNFLELNIIATVKELDTCTYESNGPTKEMLQWAMLSLQRVVALLHVMISRCTATVPAIKGKLETGHQWKLATIVLGVLGRIWAYSRFISMKSCSWYEELNSFLGKSMGTNEDPVLSSYTFPHDLGSWLGNPPYFQQGSVNRPAMENEQKLPVEDVKTAEDKSEDIVSLEMQFKEDVGEVISRDKIAKKKKKEEKKNKKKEEKKKKKKKSTKSKSKKVTKPKPVSYFKTADQIFEFLDTEKLCRKRNLKTARTRNLNKRRWIKLRKELKDFARKLLILGTEKKNISKHLLHLANVKVAELVDM